MRKMTIMLELEVGDDEVGEQAPVKDFQVKYLLADAMAEFQHPRRDPTQYVETRYPESRGTEWFNRGAKVREVTARVSLAEKIRRAALSAVPSFTECSPEEEEG